jgi:hypothetical protein
VDARRAFEARRRDQLARKKQEEKTKRAHKLELTKLLAENPERLCLLPISVLFMLFSV